jgi:protein translocase SEC61 complex gamma subunit
MDILERTWETQDRIEKRVNERIKSNKWSRVIKMSVKPTNDEFIKTLQVCCVGMILIGALGFLIYKTWTGVGDLLKDYFDLGVLAASLLA